jgi:hypothetical protein
MKPLMIILLAIICIGLGYYYFLTPKSAHGIDPKKYGNGCRLAGVCGELTAVDCGAAVDGPLYYVNNYDGEIVGKCGGYCMGQNCEGKCPPPEWTCH